MTARLVLLMSLVLFLSLLAFSLLLNHSRTAVLEEVEKSVSMATKQTLHLMTVPGIDLGMTLDPAATNLEAAMGGDPHQPPAGMFVAKRVIEHFSIELRGEPAHGETARSEEDPRSPKPAPSAETKPGPQPTGDPRNGLIGRRAQMVFLAHDEPQIRIVNDQAFLVTATVLRTASQEGKLPVDAHRPHATPESVSIAATPATFETTEPEAKRDRLAFQVPIGAYSQVFDVIRDRMLWISIGVFLLGIGLSAALARHFTRPIRDLDAALARIAGGDLEVNVTPAGTGEVSRLAVAFNAMTDELRKNRDRERELVRREKLSSLGRLAAGVAHDVRNPLHSIGLTLQNLEDVCRPAEDERVTVFERAIGLIRREIKRLDGLVAHFLSFARNEASEKSTVKLPDLVRDTALLVAKEAERREITVVVDAEPTLEPITAVPAALRSAVLNLVLNAFEATPAGGSVTLRVTSGAGVQRIEVADTGRGIAQEDRERVFDFGYTTRDSGHGLGLAMVHHTVVEEHAGRILLDSTLGKGTTVTIELPVTRPEPVATEPSNPQETA